MEIRRCLRTVFAITAVGFSVACTDSPVDPNVALVEKGSVALEMGQRTPAASGQRQAPMHYGELATFADALDLLEFGECLVEYRRANDRVTAFVVEVPDAGHERDVAPFAVRYMQKSGRTLFSGTCDVPADIRDAALERVAWGPGHGSNAAGRGWKLSDGRGAGRVTSPGDDAAGLILNRARLEDVGPAGIVDLSDYSDFDYCYVIFAQYGNAIDVFSCGNYPMGSTCESGMTYDAMYDLCIGDGGSGSGDSGLAGDEDVSNEEFEELCNPNYDPDCVLRGKEDWTPEESQMVQDARARAVQFGCTDVVDAMDILDMVNGIRFWTAQTYRFGGTLYGRVDWSSGQVLLWTGAAPGDVIHEVVHRMTGMRQDDDVDANGQSFGQKVTSCGGTMR